MKKAAFIFGGLVAMVAFSGCSWLFGVIRDDDADGCAKLECKHDFTGATDCVCAD